MFLEGVFEGPGSWNRIQYRYCKLFIRLLGGTFGSLSTVDLNLSGTFGWMLDDGFWVLGTGHWVLGTGYWVLGTGFWALGSGY